MGKKEEEEEWHEEDELERRDGGEGVRGRRWRKRIGGVGGRARLEGRRSTREEEWEKEWEKEHP